MNKNHSETRMKKTTKHIIHISCPGPFWNLPHINIVKTCADDCSTFDIYPHIPSFYNKANGYIYTLNKWLAATRNLKLTASSTATWFISWTKKVNLTPNIIIAGHQFPIVPPKIFGITLDQMRKKTNCRQHLGKGKSTLIIIVYNANEKPSSTMRPQNHFFLWCSLDSNITGPDYTAHPTPPYAPPLTNKHHTR